LTPEFKNGIIAEASQRSDAKKTNTQNPWLTWIPIANIYLMCIIAGKPGWWLQLSGSLYEWRLPRLAINRLG
jgi:hypothetical protein